MTTETSNTQTPQGTPEIRNFQLDAGALGDVAKSVNLFRGSLNLPLSLVSLPGPNGLDLDLSAFYSGNVKQSVDTWNREAPTTILGLGWSMPYTMITFTPDGTASALSGDYTLYVNGAPVSLTRVSTEGVAGEDDETVIFASRTYPLWDIRYQPSSESWTVTKDDGTIQTFGGIETERSNVQWGVRWDNFIGASVLRDGDPEPYALAWNLASIRDQLGNAITYGYENDDLDVGNGLGYTRASYLSTIVDAYGRRVALTYAEKDPAEYQAAHDYPGYPGEPDGGTAYQDRYETRYLERIDVLPPTGTGTGTEGEEVDVYYSYSFGYQLANLDASDSAEDTDRVKRYLVSLTQLRGDRQVTPPMRFGYDLDADSAGRGVLTDVRYPAGGGVTWTLDEVALNPEDDPVFSLTYEAARPEGWSDAVPRVWFGGDYIVILWSSNREGALQLQVYSYGGRWSTEPWIEDLPGTSDLDGVKLVTQSDFFALYVPSNRLYLVRKERYRFGQWSSEQPELDAGASVTEADTALVAGSDFVAVHAGATPTLYRFYLDPVDDAWQASSVSPGAEDMALAARGNVLLAMFHNDDDSVDLRGYYIDGEGAENDTWAASETLSGGDFAWQSGYANGYWSLGDGFGAGTSVASDGSGGTMRIVRWSADFETFRLTAFDVSGSSTLVSGSTILNGGELFRYDGADWTEEQWASGTDAFFGVSEDVAIQAVVDGSEYRSKMARYDAWSEDPPTWVTTDFPSDGDDPSASGTPIGPQWSGDYLTLGTSVYLRQPDGVWSTVGTLDDALGSTVINRGPAYIAYQDNPNGTENTTTYIQLLDSGAFDGDPIALENQMIATDGASGTVLAGGTAFATYPAGTDFEQASRFTLYRILDHQVDTVQTATVVSALAIETGEATRVTRYAYDATAAVFDPSGQVVQFPEVIAERVADDGAETSLGSTLSSFFNGLDPETAASVLTNYAETDSGVEDVYSLANGYLRLQQELDGDGVLVQTSTNAWDGITYTLADDALADDGAPGFALLANSVTLVSTQVEQTLENLPVIDLGGDGSSNGNGAGGDGSVASLTRTQTLEYDSSTAMLRARSVVNTNSEGQTETRTATFLYAWEVYDGMASSRLFKPVAQTTLQTGGVAGQAMVTTYAQDWGDVSGWAQYESYQWRGGVDGEDGSTDVPSFDWTDDAAREDWLRLTTIDGRSEGGLIRASRDAIDTPTTVTFDTSGLWPVAQFTGASEAHVSYTGFQPYESDAGWTTGSGNALDDRFDTDDSHTGARCVRLGPGQAMTNDQMTARSGDPAVFSCWVKTPAGDGEVDASWQIVVEGGESIELAIPDSPEQWRYLHQPIEVPAGEDSALVQLTASNDSESRAVLIDDLRFMPMACTFQAVIYDTENWLTLAQLGTNSETDRTFYDDLLRPVGAIGPDANVASIGVTFHSRDGNADGLYDPASPNSTTNVQARSGGEYDDFRDGAWQNRWNADGDASAWTVIDRALVHQGTSTDSVTLDGSEDWVDYAVWLEVTTDQESQPESDLGLTIGDRLTVMWNAAAEAWQMLDGDGTVVDGYAPSDASGVTSPMSWLLVARADAAIFLLDGQQILEMVVEDGDASIGGGLGLFAGDPGVAFGKVMTARSPIVTMAFQDGTDQPIQTQQLEDASIVVSAVLYDDLGRQSILTKAARYDSSVLGYRTDFAATPDPETGEMSGYLSDYYAGQDGRSDDQGYPYSRQRMENSTLSRLREVGQAGAELAIRPDNAHTQVVTMGVNAASDTLTDLPAASYAVRTVRDPDGKTTATIKDRLGSTVAQMWGPEGLPDGSFAASYKLDTNDNLAELWPPNAYQPPTGQPSDWVTSQGFDALNLMRTKTTPDAGTSETVYNSLGQARFLLTADGAASDPQRIVYTTYDALGRVIEQGYFEGTWDRATLEAEADREWPTDVATWRFKNTWDGAESVDDPGDDAGGALENALGRVSRVQTRQEDGTVVDESFAYDIRGNLVARTVAIGAETDVVTYTYDTLGNVVSLEYPAEDSGTDLVVAYDYDTRGNLRSIRTAGDDASGIASYDYDPDGSLSQATFDPDGASPIDRVFSYTSPGWIATLVDDLSSQTLVYDQDQGDNQPLWSGLVSAIDYQRVGTGDGAQRWTYAYDDVGRLVNANLNANLNAGSTIDASYTYDANGNVLGLTDTADGRTETYTYEEGTDRLASSSAGEYTYQPSGQVSASPDLAFDYDLTTNLTMSMTGLESGDRFDCVYGSSSQRLSLTRTGGDGSVTEQVSIPGADEQAVVERLTEGDEVAVLRYIHGPQGIVAVERDGAIYIVLQDHEGSNRLLVGGGQSLVGAYDYQPFGRDLGTPSGTEPELLRYRFAGQAWNLDLGLYDDRDRLYDPSIQRFLSTDSAGQFMSPYLYAANDPIVMVDPSGDLSVFGTVLSSVEIGVGAAMTATGFGAPIGVGLMVTGAAGLDYTIQSGDDFNTSTFFQVETAAGISTAQIEIGVSIDAISGGTLAPIVGGTIQGAGTSSLVNVFEQVNSNPGGQFDWGDYGKQMAIGAATGAISAGVSAGVSSVATNAVSKAAGEAVASAGSELVGEIVGEAIGEGVSAFAGSVLNDALYGKKVDLGAAAKDGLISGTTAGVQKMFFGTTGLVLFGGETSKATQAAKKIGVAGVSTAWEVIGTF